MSAVGKLPDFFALVSAAEGDMRKVYDHAFLIHDHLSRAGTLTEDEQGALVWPAGDLLEAGRNLREHCDKLYEAARLLRFADHQTATITEPIVDPTKLSVSGCFALYAALGTVGEVMDGLLCQPRFNKGHDLNAAGEMLDQLRDAVADAREAIRRDVASRPAGEGDASHRVFFAAEEWVDGSCMPGLALKGLTAVLTDLGKAVAK